MGAYGKLEWSDPAYEADGLRFLTFNSPALGGRGDVALFLPEQARSATDLPLVVLLHGVYCSHWAWALKGGAHRTTLEMIDAGDIPPMVLAMPSDGLWGEGSGYLPQESANFEDWIVEDVIGCLLSGVDGLGDGSAVFLAGLSMGGYGALRLGARYPDRFAAISAHSSITNGDSLREFIKRRPLAFRVDESAELEITHWMSRHAGRLPPIRFDCGIDDPLIEDNRRLHQDLEGLGIPHRYQEFPGGHKWPYWAEHLRDSLMFFAGVQRGSA